MRRVMLLEMIVAFSLTAVLIGALLYSQKELRMQQNKVNSWRQQIMARERFSLRMYQVLSTLKKCYIDEKKKGEEILFHYDNGVDPDSLFCGDVLSSLLFEQGVLYLKTISFSSTQEETMRKEILWAGVKTFHLRFFHLKTESWESFPPLDLLPSMMRIEINGIPFPFWIDS